MKRFTFFTFLLLLFTHGVASAAMIYLNEDPKPPGPVTLSFSYTSITATIDEANLSVYFPQSVGTATIKVYDASNQIVYQEAVNTKTTEETTIPVDFFDSGNFRITISYGTTTLRGTFSIP